MNPVRFSLAIEAPSDAAFFAWIITYLEQHGYSVRPPAEKWETVTELCRRLKIHSETLRRAAEHPQRPNVLIHRGPTGRIITVLTNADFDAFCTRNKQ